MSSKTCLVRQTAITRVIRGALAAGIMHFTLAAAPDGTITLTHPAISGSAAVGSLPHDDDDEATLLAEIDHL